MVLLSLLYREGSGKCKTVEHTNGRSKQQSLKPCSCHFTLPEASFWDHVPPYGVTPWFLTTIAINTDPRGHFPSCSQPMQLRIFLYTGEYDLKVFNAPIRLQLPGEMQARVRSAGSFPCASNRTSSLHILQIKAKYRLGS